MSYDIRFGVKVAGAGDDVYAVIGQPEHSSPTYNVRDIFVHSMDWDYHQGEWYPATEVIPKVEMGVRELTIHAKEYKKYEPENGWGSVSSARDALQSIVDWFYMDWSNGWNGDVPIECIYMRW